MSKTIRASEVNELYEQKYAGERLVQLQKGVPDVIEGQGKHGWRMGGVQVHSGGKRVVVVGVLDNLLKGAATQCMQVGHGPPELVSDGLEVEAANQMKDGMGISIADEQNLNLALGFDELDGIPLDKL